MNRICLGLGLASVLSFGLSCMAEDRPISLYLGYLARVNCAGSLKSSAVGDATLVQVEALPREVGCGLLLKPLKTGRSNLIMMMSGGSAHRIIEVMSAAGHVGKDALEYQVTADSEGGRP